MGSFSRLDRIDSTTGDGDGESCARKDIGFLAEVLGNMGGLLHLDLSPQPPRPWDFFSRIECAREMHGS